MLLSSYHCQRSCCYLFFLVHTATVIVLTSSLRPLCRKARPTFLQVNKFRELSRTCLRQRRTMLKFQACYHMNEIGAWTYLTYVLVRLACRFANMNKLKLPMSHCAPLSLFKGQHRRHACIACFTDGLGMVDGVFSISPLRAEDAKNQCLAPRCPLVIQYYVAHRIRMISKVSRLI